MQTNTEHTTQGPTATYERPTLDIVRMLGECFATGMQYSPNGDNNANADEEGLF